MTAAKKQLIARAVVTGLLYLLGQLAASQAWDTALWRASVAGAALAALEVLTPLNGTVGRNK